MKDLYTYALARIQAGASFRINFPARELNINGKKLIKSGKHDMALGLTTRKKNIVKELETLFNRYRFSIPSEKSETRRKLHFRAVELEELTDMDMMYGEPREEARFKLEYTLLCALMQGTLKWRELAGAQWFWRSSKYPTMIMLREWFEESVAV